LVKGKRWDLNQSTQRRFVSSLAKGPVQMHHRSAAESNIV
jgi:hypothetical protein